jgi:hypothetical protein
VATLRARRDFRGALHSARAAAGRREREIEEELHRGGEAA